MTLPGRDIPWRDFLSRLKRELKDDRVADAAGALTFFGLLALFPFLLFVVALAGTIIDPRAAERLLEQLRQVAPGQATEILGAQLRALADRDGKGVLTIGVLLALWAASGGIVATMRALNVANDVREGRPFWKVRGIALLMTLVAAALGLLALLSAVAFPALSRLLGEPLGPIVRWGSLLVAAAVVLFMWALLYWALPDVRHPFKLFTPGALVGVVVWVLASMGFSFYVSNFAQYNATYGALGGVIVLLLWMWISSLVFLLGAEINSVLEHLSPERRPPERKRLEERRAEAPGRGPEPARA